MIALVRPLELGDTSLQLHLPVAVASVPLVCLLLIARKRISRWEGGVLLLAYLAYVGLAIAIALN